MRTLRRLCFLAFSSVVLCPTFSAAQNSQWLRPTNVLTNRMFKLGAQIDF